jgi:hypothetical protein
MSPLVRIPDEWDDEPIDTAGEDDDDAIPVNLHQWPEWLQDAARSVDFVINHFKD